MKKNTDHKKDSNLRVVDDHSLTSASGGVGIVCVAAVGYVVVEVLAGVDQGLKEVLA